MSLLPILSSIFILSLLIFLQKKFSFIVDTPGYSLHKKKIYTGTPLSGGLFFLIYIIIFNENIDFELNQIFLIIAITFVGFLSDTIKDFKPIHRLAIQVLLLFLFILITNLKIISTNLFILDYLLQNNFFNLVFTIFCISILINGSNFCDGININVSGYYLILLIGMYYVSKDLNYNFELNILIFPLIIFIIFNFFSFCFLGDNGSYCLSILFGIYLIEFTNTNTQISPFFAVSALWYPCFENLFSIIRRKRKNFNTMEPDRNHFHHKLLNFLTIKFFLKRKKLSNSFTGLIICIYNSISMYFSYTFYNSSLNLIILVLINISLYLIIFNKLKNAKR